MKYMNPYLVINEELYTYQHDSFFKIELSCKHEYYTNGKCQDVSLELIETSKNMLKENGIFFKEKGCFILIGRKKTNQDHDEVFNSILPILPNIFIQISVINSRFWMVTDFDILQKGFNPLKGAPFVFRYINNALICEDENSFQLLKNVDENLKGLAKNIFGIIVLNLNQIKGKKEEIVLQMKALAVKLKYKITPIKNLRRKSIANKKLTIEDVLNVKKELTECMLENAIKLSVKPKKENKPYVLESKDKWEMRQENKHPTTNFFKFEVKIEDNEKVKEGIAEVFLPFPKRLNSSLFKKEGKVKVIEQNISLLKFGAKPSPKK